MNKLSRRSFFGAAAAIAVSAPALAKEAHTTFLAPGHVTADTIVLDEYGMALVPSKNLHKLFTTQFSDVLKQKLREQHSAFGR